MPTKKKTRKTTTKKRPAAKKTARRTVQAIPAGYHTITPYLIVRDASKAIEFYKQALAAKELYRMAGPGGRVAHAEIKIGDSVVMLADEHPEQGIKSPASVGGTPVSMLVYSKDCDSTYERAVRAGAVGKRPPVDMFYGDRTCQIEDPFGHLWSIATHKEDVSPKEMEARMRAQAEPQA
jgi:PhnB protein